MCSEDVDFTHPKDALYLNIFSFSFYSRKLKYLKVAYILNFSLYIFLLLEIYICIPIINKVRGTIGLSLS